MPNVTYVTDIPQWSNGKPGDTAGMIVFAPNGLYFCFRNYTDGYSPIWARVTNNLVDDWQNPVTKETLVRIEMRDTAGQGADGYGRLGIQVSWTPQNATSVTLNNKPVSLIGSVTVNYETSLTFIVNGPRGPRTQSIRTPAPRKKPGPKF
jgi:hypothetical protein